MSTSSPKIDLDAAKMPPPEPALSVDRSSHYNPTHIDLPPPPHFKPNLEGSSAQNASGYGTPESPLDMGEGKIDGLECLEADIYANGRGQSRRNSGDLGYHMSRSLSAAEVALSAMQYLPYPLIVLNDQKTVSLANDAMVRLLGLEDQEEDGMTDEGTTAADRLTGQTLSQMGIDMLQEGRPVWVTWETLYVLSIPLILKCPVKASGYKN